MSQNLVSAVPHVLRPSIVHGLGRDNASLFVQGVRHLPVYGVDIFQTSDSNDVSAIFHVTRPHLHTFQSGLYLERRKTHVLELQPRSFRALACQFSFASNCQ